MAREGNPAVIRIAAARGLMQADEAGVREEVLHSSAQMLALIFRNVKLAARLFEACPKGKAAELDNLLRNYRGNSEMLVQRLRAPGGCA